MFKKMVVSAVFISFIAGMAAPADADEISELRKQVENQYNELIKVQNKLLEIEAAQREQGVAVKKLESSGGFTIPETLAWIEKVKLYGDFRYRHEHIDAEEASGGDAQGRDRHRIRARIGFKAKINDEWTYDMRIATGSSDSANSTNETLGDAFSSDDIWLDRAYLTYNPTCMDGWAFFAGKMANPFVRVGKNQLIWDGDVTPEGIAFGYENKLNDKTDLFVIGGGMWAREEGGDADSSLWGIQGGLKHAFDNGDKLTWGGSYYKYGNIKDEEVFDSAEGNSTYTPAADALYLYDYELCELFGEYGTQFGETPVSFYGDYVVNTASSVDEDTGWLIGTKLGKAKKRGSWECGYEYRDSEKDSVVGIFTDSDFVDGGAEGKGHKFSAGYALAKNTKLGFTYFLSERDAGSDDKRDDKYQRMQLDLSIKF